MSDWIGMIFFVSFAVGIFVCFRIVSRRRVSTEEEFERNAAASASLLGIGAAAINGILNPSSEKGRITIEQVKQGTFNKKKENGKTIAPGNNND